MAEQEVEVENILDEILAGDDLSLYGYEEDSRPGLVSHASRARPLLSQQPAQPLQTAHHSQPLQNSQCSDSSEPSQSLQRTQRGQPVQVSYTTPIGQDAQSSASNAGGGRRQRSPSLDQASQARTQKRIRSAQDVEVNETAAEPSSAPPPPGSSKRLRTSIDMNNGVMNDFTHAEDADRPDDIRCNVPDGRGTDDHTDFSDHRDRLRHTAGAQRASHREDWHSITKDSVTYAETSPVKSSASGENQHERSLNRSPYSSQRGQERNDRIARPYQDGYRSTVQRGQQIYHKDDLAMSMPSKDPLLRRNSGSPRRNAPAIKPADKELQRSFPTSYRGDNDRPRRDEGGQGRMTGSTSMERNGMSRANRGWGSPQSQASSSNSGSIEWTNADVEDAILTNKDRPIMGSRSPIREDVARNPRRGSDPMMMGAGRMDAEPPRYDDVRYGTGVHGREANGHADNRSNNLSMNRPHDREPGMGNGWNNDPRPYGRNVNPSRTMSRSGERYFVIKSNNYQNVRKSMKEGIWATPAFNAPVLSDAFKTSSRVYLIFSVNESRHFQGYCEMVSDVGAVKHWQWTRFNDSSNNFRVRWIQIVDLPFDMTTHIRNPLNENKPVKISRDGQELPRDVGERLRELFDNMTVSNKPYEPKRVARSAPPPPPPPPREFARPAQYDPYPSYYQDDYDSYSSNREWYYEHSGSNGRAPYWDSRR